MKEYLYLLLLFIIMNLFCDLSFSQLNNLIHNSSFELSHPDAPSDAPTGIAQVHRIEPGKDAFYLLEWRSRTREATDSPGQFLHSPDWFKSPPPPNPYFTHIYGSPVFDGIGYIGMGNYELVQQKFHQYNRLEDGESYLLQMYIQLSDAGPNSVIDPTSFNFSDSELKIYIAKNNIEYKREKKFEDHCTKKYIQHANLQSIYTLATIPLSQNNMPAGTGWHKIQVLVTAPQNNADKYDWFGIELRRINYNPDNLFVADCDKNGYLLIDNITLAKGCPETCSRTTGFYDPMFSGIHDVNTPWFVTNLDNISTAIIEIRAITSQTIVRTITVNSPNGITNPIYWNGKNQGGAEVAANTYIAKCSLTNDCGTAVFSNTFVKVNGSSGNTNPPPTFPPYNTTGVLTPRPCCSGIFDYYLDGVTLSGPGKLEYIIQNNLYVATQPSNVTATSNADVLFQAGNQVNLGSGFNANAGSIVDIVIIPCPMRLMAPDNTIVSTPVQLPHTTSDDEEQGNTNPDNSANVIPNPTNGYFILKFDNTIKRASSDTRLSVYDMFGNIVYKKSSLSLNDEWYEQIDLSFCPNGIYLIKLQSGEDVYISKLVLQK